MTIAIVQARMGSARLPNKVMKPVCGTPLIGLLLERLAAARLVRKIVVATSEDVRNRPLSEYVRSLGYDVFEGSEDDVLDRFYRAAAAHRPEIVVRITGDCPLVDPDVVDAVVARRLEVDADYASNVDPPTFPDGLDVEVFRFSALERAWREAREPGDREHVTPFIRRVSDFKRTNVEHDINCSAKRWTVDELQDFDVISNVFEHFHPKRDFSWTEVLDLEMRHPEKFLTNRRFGRNEGARMSKGQKLWQRAKRVIPGGSMLLSKRPEMHLPELWPSYFSRAKGCRVWDLDGREYVDMSLMGVGTNTLGYGHPEVDDAVRTTIDAGNMSTLNCPEEVLLAERLVEIHPWADMVRLARSGGEANTIALRIARAASGRTKVAFCGYHGWHDWYLAANLGDGQNLAGHLLPGLEPLGVPQELQGTVLPFRYNRFDELLAIVEEHEDVGVIFMEVSRSAEPAEEFLSDIRRLSLERKIVLVFDECTSGFRETFGGLHKKFNVDPDLAVFGKTLGNGYAITAVIGRREIMEAAQKTFISSTFWTERIGPTAALASLQVMERVRSWEFITQTGRCIQEGWTSLANKHGISITLSGLPSLAAFTVQSANAVAYKTLIAQEMLGRGYLASTAVYASIAHEPAILDGYFNALDPIFGLIRECEDGRDVTSLLHGPLCHTAFKRLN